VCRNNKRVQIHHLDENPSNHALDNLAVLCLDCHDDQQVRGGFTRKYSAAEIVHYRESWRRIVRLRLDAGGEVNNDRRILIAEAMHDVIDICHGWRDSFRFVVAPQDRSWEAADLWVRTTECAPKSYNEEERIRLAPFFEIGLDRVIEVVTRVQDHCADVLPYEFRALLLRTQRGFDSSKQRYDGFTRNLSPQKETNDRYYGALFETILSTLRALAQAAELVQRTQLGDDLTLYEGPEEEYDYYDGA